MKAKLFLILIVFVFAISLTACEEAENTGVIYGIETAAVVLGYVAAQQPDIDMALRNLYDLATKGRLTAEGVNSILLRLDMKDPFELLIIRRVLRLAELIGANVVEGQITDIANIPPEFINAVSRGYVEGYDTFILSEVKQLFSPLPN